MEIKSTICILRRWAGRSLATIFLLVAVHLIGIAQPMDKVYTIKNGKMIIKLNKGIAEASLDSFIVNFDLSDLKLKEFIKTNITDSLKKLGWHFDLDTKEFFVISKSLEGFDDMKDPANKIMFTEKFMPNEALFPAKNNGVVSGYNKFRNKYPFEVNDSTVTFFLRGNTKARKVMLAGSFNDWSPDVLSMDKTDSGWIAKVKIGEGKYWYKFVIDGRWEIDNDNILKENDGRGNINSVYFKTNYLFSLNAFTYAKKVFLAGNFTEWENNKAPMVRTATGWELPLYLTEGTYTYRFIVDNQWQVDPTNPDRLPNEYGEFNSVIRVGKPYQFKLEGYTDAKVVVVSGSFNGWREDELFMNKTAAGWELPYTLGSGNYEYRYKVDGKWVASREPSPIEIKSRFQVNTPLVIEPNYTFRLKGYNDAKSVILSGDFNKWSENTFVMKREGEEWVFPVHLSIGKHLYKFRIDGKWITDPGNTLWEQNEYGTGNSVLWIEREPGKPVIL